MRYEDVGNGNGNGAAAARPGRVAAPRQAGPPLSIDEALDTALAPNTRTAYRKAFGRFEAWCLEHGVEPLDARPNQVARFLVEVASTPRSPDARTGGAKPLAMATIRVIVAAINRAYRERDRRPPTADPTVTTVLRGIGRATRERGRQVQALRAHEAARVLERLDEEAADPARRVIALRDAAIVAVGFAAALRRSEICALEVADVEIVGSEAGAAFGAAERRWRRPAAAAVFWPPATAAGVNLGDARTSRRPGVEPRLRRGGAPGEGFARGSPSNVERDGLAHGMVLHIRRSKTDPFGKGHDIAVPEGELIRPVSRLRAWLRATRIRSGPLFQTLRRGGHLQGRPLHPGDIGRLVKQRVAEIGLDPAEYSGHSLRAGFVTSAAENGARLDKIMEVTRHKTPGMVLRYVRQADAFRDHAGAGFL